MATFWEKAAHSVDHMFSLYFVYFSYFASASDAYSNRKDENQTMFLHFSVAFKSLIH